MTPPDVAQVPQRTPVPTWTLPFALSETSEIALAAPPTPPPDTPTLLPTDAPALPGDYGEVVDVIDGDTIDVWIGGQPFRVRYIGINTPETNEPCGAEATAANAGLVSGQTVRLVKDVSETDQYERLLRYVYVGDVLVNAELVAQGYAEAVEYPPDTAQATYLESLEQQARAANLKCYATGVFGGVPTATKPPPNSDKGLLPTATRRPIQPAPQPTPPCDPSYPDVCLLDGIGDYDCWGGSGDGPNYVQGPIRVLSPDPFDLDRDGDGFGCDSDTPVVQPTTTPRYRIGAECADGWDSTATGRGACSHHGGVYCWRYSDGTCTKP
jgi:micrococcal nuclease